MTAPPVFASPLVKREPQTPRFLLSGFVVLLRANVTTDNNGPGASHFENSFTASLHPLYSIRAVGAGPKASCSQLNPPAPTFPSLLWTTAGKAAPGTSDK